MKKLLTYLVILSAFILASSGSRILAILPAPFYSHQSVFRPLMRELAKRGHELVVITTDPTPKESLPANLTEIDIHDVSYELRNSLAIKSTGKPNEIYDQVAGFFDLFAEVMDSIIDTTDVQKLINDRNQHFDLLFVEACVRSALVFSHIYKAPVITISSLGSIGLYTKYLGIPEHPILYPTCLHQKINNLTVWDKVNELYYDYLMERISEKMEAKEDEMLKRHFGDDVPPVSELKKNVAMLMLNVHHIWEGNRPVPPNVVYIGGLHLQTNYSKDLSTDLKSYLDSSKHGVIYVSFGSLIVPSIIENMKILINSFSKLPYDILLKWDDVPLSEYPSNVKVTKWVPQKELLYHPKVRLFITQGGLQSTDEAIAAGVPVIGIPLLGDQWYNVEKYVEFKIGLKIDLGTVTEKQILDAVNTVIDDKRYKNNIILLRTLMYDQPQNPLERAVWWTEYIIRHGRSPHLMSPAAHMSSWEYFEMDLLLVSLFIFIIVLSFVLYIAKKLLKIIKGNNKVKPE